MFKIGIYGFGGVGCAIYNELKEYNDIYVLVDEKRKLRYEKEGLIINDVNVYPKYITCGYMDLIIISVKNYQLEEALPSLNKFINKNTIILPLLNGITAHDVIQNYYPHNRILYGVINVESNKVGNRCTTGGVINLQYGDRYNYHLRYPLIEIRKIFNKYHIKNNIYHNTLKRVWHKWALNLAINQISALCNATYKDMSHPLLLNTFNDIFNEVLNVSNYYNIGLTKEDVDDLNEMCANFNSNRVTSLTLDVNKNKENEIDSFGLELIDLAKNAGIDVPVNKTIYNLVKSYSENKKDIKQD